MLYSGLRHTSSKRAARYMVKAALLWQLGGVKQVYLAFVRRRRVVRPRAVRRDA